MNFDIPTTMLKRHASSWLFAIMSMALASFTFCVLCLVLVTGHAGVVCLYSLLLICPVAFITALLSAYFIPIIKEHRSLSLVAVSTPTLLFFIAGVAFPDNGLIHPGCHNGSVVAVLFIGVPTLWCYLVLIVIQWPTRRA